MVPTLAYFQPGKNGSPHKAVAKLRSSTVIEQKGSEEIGHALIASYACSLSFHPQQSKEHSMREKNWLG